MKRKQGSQKIGAFMVLLCAFAALSGCESGSSPEADNFVKPPKPVSVMTLSRSRQLQKQLITGSVAPWKTEQIGFEIAGRVSFVIEPNESVSPKLDSKSTLPATPIARVDEERFRIAVETAQADVAVAQRRLDANQVAIEQRLPTAIASSEAELQLAETENQRAIRLSGQNAISRSELDSASTRVTVARSGLAAAKGELSQARAEQLALKAQVARAQHAQSEAERNLRSTTLFSSFRGIVSAVHTVPGSYVGPGDPVVTIQMMDPMLVQFEVSAQQSRRYAKGDILQVLMTNRSGERQIVSGIVYTIDSVADPSSRTYTVTLHVRNEEQTLTPAGVDANNIAHTDFIYPLNLGPIITGDQRQLVEQRCLHTIGDETFIWKIKNRKWNQPSNTEDRILVVERVKVKASSNVIPLLGKWNFVPIEFPDGADIDLKHDLITGKIVLPTTVSEYGNWEDRRVLMEQTDWVFRTGDVVQVVMTGSDAFKGLFVPMKAVLHKDGKTFLHVVEASDSELTRVNRIEVNILSENLIAEDSVLLQVNATDPSALQDGMRVVIGGTHYLEDRDQVRVVDKPGSNE